MLGSLSSLLAGLSLKTSVAVAAASATVVTGAGAAAGVLPAPLQNVAHERLGAPAPSPDAEDIPALAGEQLLNRCEAALEFVRDGAQHAARGEVADLTTPAGFEQLKLLAGSASVAEFCERELAVHDSEHEGQDGTDEAVDPHPGEHPDATDPHPGEHGVEDDPHPWEHDEDDAHDPHPGEHDDAYDPHPGEHDDAHDPHPGEHDDTVSDPHPGGHDDTVSDPHPGEHDDAYDPHPGEH